MSHLRPESSPLIYDAASYFKLEERALVLSRGLTPQTLSRMDVCESTNLSSRSILVVINVQL